MATPASNSPIPADDESVEIDTKDVKLDGSDPAESTTSTAKRLLDMTEIEGSFKRGVTSVLEQRPLKYTEGSLEQRSLETVSLERD
jgi:hypothetical protein